MRQVIHCIGKKENLAEPDHWTDLVIPNNLKVTQAKERCFLLFDTKADDRNAVDQVVDDKDRE